MSKIIILSLILAFSNAFAEDCEKTTVFDLEKTETPPEMDSDIERKVPTKENTVSVLVCDNQGKRFLLKIKDRISADFDFETEQITGGESFIEALMNNGDLREGAKYSFSAKTDIVRITVEGTKKSTKIVTYLGFDGYPMDPIFQIPGQFVYKDAPDFDCGGHVKVSKFELEGKSFTVTYCLLSGSSGTFPYNILQVKFYDPKIMASEMTFGLDQIFRYSKDNERVPEGTKVVYAQNHHNTCDSMQIRHMNQSYSLTATPEDANNACGLLVPGAPKGRFPNSNYVFKPNGKVKKADFRHFLLFQD